LLLTRSKEADGARWWIDNPVSQERGGFFLADLGRFIACEVSFRGMGLARYKVHSVIIMSPPPIRFLDKA
jgi:hypothetical protein